MPEEQKDFFDKLDQKPEQSMEKTLEIRALAREAVNKLTDKDSIEKTVKGVLAGHNLGMEDFEEVCRLVENTMIDDDGHDSSYWQK